MTCFFFLIKVMKTKSPIFIIFFFRNLLNIDKLFSLKRKKVTKIKAKYFLTNYTKFYVMH